MGSGIGIPSVPPLTLDPAPVLSALDMAGAAVVTAPTGAGKSTLIPPALMQKHNGQIIVTEPRRVAAMALARFLANRIGQEVGEEIGFQIRFERWPGTRLTFMTPGVLIRHLQSGQNFPMEVAVVDEFHERDLLTDAAVALLRDLRRRTGLRVVVMSATLEAKRVAEYLGAIHIDFGASAIQESPDGEVLHNGRYEVHILYRPGFDLPQVLREIENRENQGDPRFHPGGGILVFLPGKREIEEAIGQVLWVWPDAVALPLHSECSEEEIRAALNPPQGRRWVVLATNIAETSITIPDVRYVVDTGMEKLEVWDPRTGAASLRLVPIARSSAAQRAGRAGRTGPGVVFRLWSREDHARRPEFRTPEILRADLGHIALQLLDMGIRPSSLEWLDAPPRERWEAAEVLLRRLGALSPDGQLTPVGKEMAKLPLEPRLARAVVEAVRNGGEGMDFLLLTVSAASVQRLFLREEKEVWRRGRQELAEVAREGGSDLFAAAEALARFERSKRAADELGLRVSVAEEAIRIRNQLREILQDAGIRWESSENLAAAREAARRALVTALADGLRIREGVLYQAVHPLADGRKPPAAWLDRNSPLASSSPDLLCARAVRMIQTRRGEMPVITSAVRVRPEELPILLGEDRLAMDRDGPVYNPERDRVGYRIRYRLDGKTVAEGWEDTAGPETARVLAETLVRSPWSCGPRHEAASRLQKAVEECAALLARDPARAGEGSRLLQVVVEILARRLEGFTSMGQIPLEMLDPSVVLREALGEDPRIVTETLRSRFPDRVEIDSISIGVEYTPEAVIAWIPEGGLRRLRDETVRAALADAAAGRDIRFAVPGMWGTARDLATLRVARALHGFPTHIWTIINLNLLPLGEPVTVEGPDGPVVAGYLGLAGTAAPWRPELYGSPDQAEASVRAVLAAELRRIAGSDEAVGLLQGRSIREAVEEWRALEKAAEMIRAGRETLRARIREVVAQVQRKSWSWVGQDRVRAIIEKAAEMLDDPALSPVQVMALEAEFEELRRHAEERQKAAESLYRAITEIREMTYGLTMPIRRMWRLLRTAEEVIPRPISWADRDEDIQNSLTAALAFAREALEEARAIADWIDQLMELTREMICPVCGTPDPDRCEHHARQVREAGQGDLLALPDGHEVVLARIRAGEMDAVVLTARRDGDWISFTTRRPEDLSEHALQPLTLQRVDLSTLCFPKRGKEEGDGRVRQRTDRPARNPFMPEGEFEEIPDEP